MLLHVRKTLVDLFYFVFECGRDIYVELVCDQQGGDDHVGTFVSESLGIIFV